jgi:hypothetical protein
VILTIFIIAIAAMVLFAALPTLPGQVRYSSRLGAALALLLVGAMIAYLVER